MQDEFYIPKDIFDELISHCKDASPNEACGILAGIENKASRIYKMTNIEKSPVSYLMDSKEQFKVMKDIRENNLKMLAIFHSHPSSQAYPSAKDLNLAFYEDSIYIIVSLIESDPAVKGFLIKEGKIKEVAIAVKE